MIGGGCGLFCAFLGAFVDYVLMRKREEDADGNLPGCMMIMVGMLGLAGVSVIGISFLLSGTVLPAIVVVAGVLVGFFSGFLVLFSVGVFLSSRQVDFLE